MDFLIHLLYIIDCTYGVDNDICFTLYDNSIDWSHGTHCEFGVKSGNHNRALIAYLSREHS